MKLRNLFNRYACIAGLLSANVLCPMTASAIGDLELDSYSEASGSLTVSWRDFSRRTPNGYAIFYSGSETPARCVQGGGFRVSNRENHFRRDSLDTERTYLVTVCSYEMRDGREYFSNETSVAGTTMGSEIRVAAPTSVSVDPTSRRGELRITWRAPQRHDRREVDPQGYTVTFGTQGPPACAGVDKGNTFEHIRAGLTPGQVYFVSVCGYVHTRDGGMSVSEPISDSNSPR
jgi:hypothetical protein